jgi:hypothetical protein
VQPPKSVLVAILAMVGPVFAGTTNAQIITHVLYDGDADYAYFVGQSSWTTPEGCSSYYATLAGTQPGKEKLLAIVLAAHAAGRRVSFRGDCTGHPNYLHLTYVTVTD